MKTSKTVTPPMSEQRRRPGVKSRCGNPVFREVIQSPQSLDATQYIINNKSPKDSDDLSLRDVTPRVCNPTDVSRTSASLVSSRKKSQPLYNILDSTRVSSHSLDSDGYQKSYEQSMKSRKRGIHVLAPLLDAQSLCEKPVPKKQKLFSFFDNDRFLFRKDNVSPLDATLLFRPFRFLNDKVFKSFLSNWSFSPKRVFSRERFSKHTNPFRYVQDTTSQRIQPVSTGSSLSFNSLKPHFNKNPFNPIPLTTLQYFIPFYTRLPDLISEQLGGRVIYSTDNFFSPAENLLKCSPPQKSSNGYVDGWETRRKKTSGHNWCLIQLGSPGNTTMLWVTFVNRESSGRIYGVEINTRYMEDSYAPYVSVETANLPNLDSELKTLYKEHGWPEYQSGMTGGEESPEMESAVSGLLKNHVMKDGSQWRDIVPMYPLVSSDHPQTSRYFFGSSEQQTIPVATHIRVNLFPDGGLARLRLYSVGASPLDEKECVNVASVSHGAVVIGCSNDVKGSSQNLLLDTPPVDMFSGWLTARNPGRHPYIEASSTGQSANLVGEHWVILRLAARVSHIEEIDLDTTHYIGNAPNKVEIQIADVCDHVNFDDIEAQQQLVLSDGTNDALWTTLLPATAVDPNRHHKFLAEKHFTSHHRLPPSQTNEEAKEGVTSRLNNATQQLSATHLKMIISPDGGIARIRVWCRGPFLQH